MARQTILDERLILEICNHVQASGNVETAIGKAGIGRDTYYRWKRAVVAGKGSKLQKRLMDQIAFYMADFQARMESVIQLAAVKGQWQAAAWWLERKDLKKYGRKRLYMYAEEDEVEDKKVTNARFSLFGPPDGGVKSEPDTPTTEEESQSTTDGSTTTTRSPASTASTNLRTASRG